MQVIESAANEKVKHVAKLAKKSYRDEAGEFVIEGLRAVTDAQKCGANLLQVFMREDLGLSFGEAEAFVVSEKAFLKMSQTQNPQGVLAVAQMRRFSLADVLDKACVVFLDRVADPGNLGTIIRTADAVGAGGVVLSAGCADIYNPKTVRATMGSLFHLPVLTVQNTAEALEAFSQKGKKIVAGALSEKAQSLFRADLGGPAVIVVGNEANGIGESTLSHCDTLVQIPMAGAAESLNAAVAASVLLYEHYRQNNELL